MGGEGRAHVDLPETGHQESDSGHPLVEGGDDERLRVAESLAELLEKDGDKEAEDDGVVGLRIRDWDPDPALLPQLELPLVQLPRRRPDVEEDDPRVAIDEPATEADAEAHLVQSSYCHRRRRSRLRLHQLHLHRHRRLVVRAQHGVLLPQLLHRHPSLRPQHRVDPAHLVRHLPTPSRTRSDPPPPPSRPGPAALHPHTPADSLGSGASTATAVRERWVTPSLRSVHSLLTHSTSQLPEQPRTLLDWSRDLFFGVIGRKERVSHVAQPSASLPSSASLLSFFTAETARIQEQ